MNLKSTSQFPDQYRELLSVSDIQTQSGLYTSASSCQAGREVALSFCSGRRPDEEAAAEQEPQEDDIDTTIGEDKLKEFLPNFPSNHLDEVLEDSTGGGSEVVKEGDSNVELIALMEEVLTSLKGGQSSTQDTDDKKQLADLKESSIMELDEALKQLN